MSVPDVAASNTPKDLRTHLPEIVAPIRRHHFLPHGFVFAIILGVRLGWRNISAVPAPLRSSFRCSVGISLGLIALQALWLGHSFGPNAGFGVLVGSAGWALLTVPLLFSQLSLVRNPDSGQLYPSFGIPNSLTIYRLLNLPFLLLGTIAGMEAAAWGVTRGTVLLLVLYAAVALSDFLDGLTARLMHRVSDFGRIYDPICDILVFVSSGIAFWYVGLIPTPYLILVLLRFGVPLLGGAFLYAYRGPFPIRATLSGKVAVFSLACFLGSNLLLVCAPGQASGLLREFFLWVSSAALIAHIVLTLRSGFVLFTAVPNAPSKDSAQ